MIGKILKNKHNGRICTIKESEIADNGIILYTDTDGRYITDWDIEQHWTIVEEEE